MKGKRYLTIFISLVLIFSPFVTSVVEAQTTVYFDSFEKTLETGEEKVYYQVGNSIAVRSNKQPGSVSYLHADWLGGTALITNKDGQRQARIIYYPYGKEKDELPVNLTDQFYTGQRKDESSGLYFYNARYYNPKTGYFISADKAQGPNRYAYALNNPVVYNDPMGSQCSDPNNSLYDAEIGYTRVYEGTVGTGPCAQEPLYLPDDFWGFSQEEVENLAFASAGFIVFAAGVPVAVIVGGEVLPLAYPVIARLVTEGARLGDKVYSRSPILQGTVPKAVGVNEDLESIARLMRASPEAAEWELVEFTGTRGTTIRQLTLDQMQIIGGTGGMADQKINLVRIVNLEEYYRYFNSASGPAMQQYVGSLLHETSHIADPLYQNLFQSFVGEVRAYSLGVLSGSSQNPVTGTLWSTTYRFSSTYPPNFGTWLFYNIDRILYPRAK